MSAIGVTPRLAFKPINATPGLVVPFCVLSCRAAARDRDPLRRGLGFVYGDRDRSLHVPLCRDRRAVTSALTSRSKEVYHTTLSLNRRVRAVCTVSSSVTHLFCVLSLGHS